MIYGPPEHHYEKYYQLKKGDTYVELGAWHGNYSQIAVDKVGLEGRVVLIEPCPYSVMILNDRFKNYPNVIIVQKAIWKENTELDFFSRAQPYDHLVDVDFCKHMNVTDIMKVQAITFNELLKQLNIDKIDLLTVDIEGAEKELLESGDFQIVKHIAIAVYHIPKNYRCLINLAQQWFRNVTIEDEGIMYGRRWS